MVSVAVTRALLDCGVRMQEHEIEPLSNLVARRGYSPAELAYAVQELPFDHEVDWKKKQGQSLTAADFERIVSRLRRLRASLSMQLRVIDVNKLVQEYPGELAVSDFEVTSFDGDNEPLYRYRYHRGEARAAQPIAVLSEAPPVERKREAAGTFSMGDLVKVELQSINEKAA